MKAFPSTEPIYGNNVVGVKENSGMDLRDYFAGIALPTAIREMEEAESYDLNDVGIVAYQYADAMMKAREQ